MKETFDLSGFIRRKQHGQFVDHGRELQLHCECSDDKTKQTLWVNTDKRLGFCFRCRKRYALVDIVQMLEGCAFHEAIGIIREGSATRHRLSAVLEKYNAAFDEESEVKEAPVKIALPEEYQPILAANEVPPYLRERKVRFKDCLRYELGLCKVGFYGNRVIIPVYDVDGTMASFVARWMGVPPNKSVKKVLYPKGSRISRVVFNYRTAAKHDTVVVCEGVFDAMRVGRNAVALNGKHASQDQISLLSDLGATRTLVVLLDTDAADDAEHLAGELAEVCDDVRIATLPSGRKDPGESTPRELARVVSCAKLVSSRRVSAKSVLSGFARGN